MHPLICMLPFHRQSKVLLSRCDFHFLVRNVPLPTADVPSQPMLALADEAPVWGGDEPTSDIGSADVSMERPSLSVAQEGSDVPSNVTVMPTLVPTPHGMVPREPPPPPEDPTTTRRPRKPLPDKPIAEWSPGDFLDFDEDPATTVKGDSTPSEGDELCASLLALHPRSRLHHLHKSHHQQSSRYSLRLSTMFAVLFLWSVCPLTLPNLVRSTQKRFGMLWALGGNERPTGGMLGLVSRAWLCRRSCRTHCSTSTDCVGSCCW